MRETTAGRLVTSGRSTSESAAPSTGAFSGARRIGRALVSHPRLTIGIGIILIITALSLLAPVIAPYDPDAQDFRSRLASPSSSHWLGGDEIGRDQLSRLMYAGRVSLAVGFPSMAVAVVLGVVIGGLAGFYAGWVDRILMRLTDLVLVFPTFFLLILAVATFGRSLTLLVLMIGLTAWPTNARVVRALMLNLRNRDFVVAARVNGARDGWIILRHLIPQLTPIVIASATIRVANNILVESGLSFLGLGVAPPTPTWGNMVTEGADLMRQAWWLVAAPGATLFLVVMAFNLAGEGLRDLLDPQRKKR
jgi:peptide/nickel transport system permease protein